MGAPSFVVPHHGEVGNEGATEETTNTEAVGCKRKRRSIGFAGPHIKLGSKNSVVTVPACDFVRAKQLMATEFANLLIDQCNRVISKLTGMGLEEPTDELTYLELGDGFVDRVVRQTKERYGGEKSHLLGELSFMPRTGHNLSIFKIGPRAKFSAHQDKSEILNSSTGRTRKCCANCGRLPQKWEMPVVTLVTGIGNIKTEVEWTIGGRVVGSATTYNRDIHFQCPGVQSPGVLHQSANKENRKNGKGAAQNVEDVEVLTMVDGKEVRGRNFRKIETFRTVLCCRCDKEQYLDGIERDGLVPGPGNESKKPFNVYNVTNHFTDPVGLLGVTPTEINDGTEDICKERASKRARAANEFSNFRPPERFSHTDEETKRAYLDEKYNEFFLNAELNDAASGHVKRIAALKPSVGLERKCRVHHLRHYDIAKKGIELGLALQYVDSDGNAVHDQPLFAPDNRLLREGEHIRPSRLPFTVSKQSSNVMDSSCPNVAAVVQAYKNGPKGFRAHTKFARYYNKANLEDQEQRREFERLFWETVESPLEIHGFGGSTQKGDTNTRDYSTTTFDEPTYYLGSHQKMTSNKNNSALSEIYEQQRPIAIFIDVAKWGDPQLLNKKKGVDKDAGADVEGGSDTAKTAELDNDLLFLGYYRIKELGNRTMTEEEIIERFRSLGMGGYLDSNWYNVSHMLHGYYNARLERIFDLEETIALKEGGVKVLESVDVCVEDARALSVPLELAKKILMKRCNIGELDQNPNRTVPTIMESDIRKAVLHDVKGKDDFVDKFQSPLDENQQFVPRDFFKYRLDVNDAVDCVASVGAANAYRFHREWSVFEEEEEVAGVGLGEPERVETRPGKIHAMPAMKGPAACLPNPLRSVSVPNSNTDLDVCVQFSSMQCRKLISQLHAEDKLPDLTNHREIEGNVMSFLLTDEDFLDAGVCKMVTECLFMTTVMRLTGYAELLAKYDAKGFEKLHLPIRDCADHFCRWLVVACGKERLSAVQSKQHQGSLPKLSFVKMIDLLRSLAGSKRGFERVEDYLVRSKGNHTRMGLIDALTDAIADCGELHRSDRLRFLVNKVLTDVEATLPLFAGIDEPGQGFMGWGAAQGLEALRRDDGSRMTFEEFHSDIKSVLEDETRTDADKLASIGFERRTTDEGEGVELVSLHGWRPFSRSDSEQFLCKVWLAIIHSHQSRNVSLVKRSSNQHCYPLRTPGEWEPIIQPIMSLIWMAYERARRSNPICLGYPDLLDYINNIETIAESQKRKWRKNKERRVLS